MGTDDYQGQILLSAQKADFPEPAQLAPFISLGTSSPFIKAETFLADKSVQDSRVAPNSDYGLQEHVTVPAVAYSRIVYLRHTQKCIG